MYKNCLKIDSGERSVWYDGILPLIKGWEKIISQALQGLRESLFRKPRISHAVLSVRPKALANVTFIAPAPSSIVRSRHSCNEQFNPGK